MSENEEKSTVREDASKESIENNWVLLNQSIQESNLESHDLATEAVEDKIEEISRSNNDDDSSDGISIISDSDASVSSMTIDDICRQHLRNLKYSQIKNLLPEAPLSSQQDVLLLRQNISPAGQNQSKIQTKEENRIDPVKLPRYSLTFVVLALVSVLAIIGTYTGRIQKYLLADKELEIFQRIEELELKNNLLRAEIDLLNKQMKYLLEAKTGSTETPKSVKGYYKESPEKLKVWAGKGKHVEELRIPKKALKVPYTCGENQEDIAGICIQNVEENETAEEHPNTKKKKEEDAGALPFNINLNNVLDNIFEETPILENLDNYQGKTKQEDNAGVKEDNNNLREKRKAYKDKKHWEHNNEDKLKERRKRFKEGSGNEKREFKEKRNKQNEGSGYKKYERDISEESHDRFENSGDKKQRKRREKGNARDHSEESFENSGDKKQRKRREREHSEESHEKFENSGDKKQRKHRSRENERDRSKEQHDKEDWHEKLMKNRENFRNEKKANWYIERQNGREEARDSLQQKYQKKH